MPTPSTTKREKLGVVNQVTIVINPRESFRAPERSEGCFDTAIKHQKSGIEQTGEAEIFKEIRIRKIKVLKMKGHEALSVMIIRNVF